MSVACHALSLVHNTQCLSYSFARTKWKKTCFSREILEILLIPVRLKTFRPETFHRVFIFPSCCERKTREQTLLLINSLFSLTLSVLCLYLIPGVLNFVWQNISAGTRKWKFIVQIGKLNTKVGMREKNFSKYCVCWNQWTCEGESRYPIKFYCQRIRYDLDLFSLIKTRKRWNFIKQGEIQVNGTE